MSTSVAVSSPATLTGKYLTVVLAEEAYGLTVLRIREIIRFQNIRPIPQMPDFVKGVINLRGRVIPIVDLRLKFGLKAEITERSCIVVTQIKTQSEQTLQMGLIVDSVEEVVTISAADVEPTPDFGANVDTRYLLGMAKIKGQVKALLDLDRIIAPDALKEISGAL